MASNSSKCVTCAKGKAMYKCQGCEQSFCFDHLTVHKQELGQELDDIANQRNIFKEILIEYERLAMEHPSIKQINHWEEESIRIIQQTAQQTREMIYEQVNISIEQIEMKLDHLTNEIKILRNENDYNEIDLKPLKIRLENLQEHFDQTNHIEIEEDSTLIKKLQIIKSSRQSFVDVDTKWNAYAITIAGGNGEGSELNQLNMPHEIAIDENQNVYVVDLWNNRIVQWKKDANFGEIVAGGNGQGHENNQLNQPVHVIIDEKTDTLIIADRDNKRVVQWPRQKGQFGQTIISDIACSSLTMSKNGDLYVCDNEKHEVRRWRIGDYEGVLVAGGNGKGRNLNQLDGPQSIVVDENESVYISDYENHRVMKWIRSAREGILVAGGHGKGTSLKQLSYPCGIFVDRFESVYVADCINDRIVRWKKGAIEGEIIVGSNGDGDGANQLSAPVGLSFDNENNLYVVDEANNRIQKFLIIEKKSS